MTLSAGASPAESPGAVRVLAYASSEKAPLYRAIMRLFMNAKERFTFHLQQQEVVDGLKCAEVLESEDPAEIVSALAQLCESGNLQVHAVPIRFSSVDDFLNPGRSFHLTPSGEAAERALSALEETAGSEPAIQCSAAEIKLVLLELKDLSRQAEPDRARVYRGLSLLRILFDSLSLSAETVLSRLESIDLHVTSDRQAIRRLIDRAQRFVDELILESGNIVEIITNVDASGFDGFARLIEQRPGAGLGPIAGLPTSWNSLWNRLRTWFVSRPGMPSNLEVLRERARTAIASRLDFVTNIAEQQRLRISRSADFQTLARWFAEAPSDAEAHLLWRAAFGLCPARHLTIDDAALDDREMQEVPAHVSWLDAPPLAISVSGRARRGNSQTDGLRRIIDRTSEKRKLAAASHAESQRLFEAQRRFGAGCRMRFSELESLEAAEFELFLDVLGEAVAVGNFPSEAVDILSGDGCLRVRLEPTAEPDEARILTKQGTFVGPDQWITIEPAATARDFSDLVPRTRI